jgi:NAD-dependent dihydropyrimidine dehydrogenase PreA subunit
VVIGDIGVASDKYLLLIVADEDTDERLAMPAVVDKLATEYQVSRRETVVGAVADARAGVRRTLFEESGSRRSMIAEGGGTYRFNDLGSILAWFANCSLCGQCLEACPVYEGEFGGMLGLGRSPHTALSPLAALVEISHWLASCGGCGMCAEMCQQDVPLTLLISALSHRIRTEMGYTAGDPTQRLPWT